MLFFEKNGRLNDPSPHLWHVEFNFRQMAEFYYFCIFKQNRIMGLNLLIYCALEKYKNTIYGYISYCTPF